MDALVAVSPSGFDAKFPSIDKPGIVGEYCVTRARRIQLGRSQLRYLCAKYLESGTKCDFNLSEGYDIFDGKDELKNEKIDVILEWILAHAPPGTPLKKVCHDVDIVCWRGLLVRLAAIPFVEKGSWAAIDGEAVAVVRFRSTIFLCEYATDAKLRRIRGMTARDKLMTYWGFKFEQYVTTDLPEEEPCTSRAVTNMEEFCTVLTTRLGGRADGVRLLFSAETDCVDSDGKYVELKTQRAALRGGFWREKALKWWLQSFLGAIESIVVGFRDDNGVVSRLERVSISNLHRGAHGWSGGVCLNFLHALLKALKAYMNEESRADLEYYLMEFSAEKQQHVTIRRLPPKHDFEFLTPEFIRHFS